MLKKFNRGQIWSTTSLLGTKHGFIRMNPKVNNNPLFGYFKMNRNQQKLFVHALLPSKWLLVSSVTGHVTTVALEDRRTVNTDWYTTICLPKVINELRRTNRNHRIILYHDNASCHTARQTLIFYPVIMSNWWLIVRIHLIYHLMTSFCSQTLKIRCMVSDLSRLKQLLKHFVHWFLKLQP